MEHYYKKVNVADLPSNTSYFSPQEPMTLNQQQDDIKLSTPLVKIISSNNKTFNNTKQNSVLDSVYYMDNSLVNYEYFNSLDNIDDKLKFIFKMVIIKSDTIINYILLCLCILIIILIKVFLN